MKAILSVLHGEVALQKFSLGQEGSARFKDLVIKASESKLIEIKM